jgi:hypothetical protein
VRVELKAQKQVFWTIFFSLGFFVYGVSANKADFSSQHSVMMAKAPVVQAPSRGIASE